MADTSNGNTLEQNSNVVLTIIDRRVPRPVLWFCSRVFPLEVSANSTLNAGVGYPLWSHGLPKHRRAECQLPHPLPFTLLDAFSKIRMGKLSNTYVEGIQYGGFQKIPIPKIAVQYVSGRDEHREILYSVV